MASSFPSSSSISVVQPLPSRVFVNFRGDELRDNIISHLEKALIDSDIAFFIDKQIVPGTDINILFKEIEKSKIALAFFSERYTESNWCLNELVKIMEEVEENNFIVIPIFFKVEVDDVKNFTGEFGKNLYNGNRLEYHKMPDWKNALKSAATIKGLKSADYSTESDFIVDIIVAVKKVRAQILSGSEGGEATNFGTMVSLASPSDEHPIMGQRLEQLAEKLYGFKYTELRIVGIVGMSGIGKSTLAKSYYEKKRGKLNFAKYITGICEKSEHRPHWLEDILLNGEGSDAEMFTKKFIVVLDDVTHKDQVQFLREIRKSTSIRAGSKIVITTRDKSLIEDLVDDIYVVPGLNNRDASQLFNHHAGGKFPELSKKFVEYADGNPRALTELGKELFGKDEVHWNKRLETLPHCCNQKILTELKISYDKLNDNQKDAFLDIACFFRSEEEDYVKCLLADVSVSGDAVKDLVDTCLICISAGRIEMHNLLTTLGKELGSSNQNKSGKRMWIPDKIIETLCSIRSEKVPNEVRGVFLDMSQINVHDGNRGKKVRALNSDIFTKRFNQKNLRYLKIYDSLCSQKCVNGKVSLPEGISFQFQEIRYLHWLRFPLDQLPFEFDPQNLMDLRLPYSQIKGDWTAAKEAPNLRWVDLSFSPQLTKLSALSKSVLLRRVNLEGCANLKELPREMRNMTSLVFMNLRGCVMLSSLPDELHLISLKILILSGCSKFNKFELFSENLEFLHLDGTAIKNLPESIQNFQKLVFLNLKECKMLGSLPNCLYKLKALEELRLSGCKQLVSFPDIWENMGNLQILLLDGTSIGEVPSALIHSLKFREQVVCQLPLRMNGVSLLRRLCLRRNNKIRSLGSNISQLYHLKWLDLKYCKNLESISTLPPNLQCLDAHECTSLKTVASPLAFLMPPTQQVPTSFIFTNCDSLEHAVENDIVCYAHNKSLLLSEALNCHKKGVPFEALIVTCFPGREVPAWFSHRASGAELKQEIPGLWSENGFVGIVLCVVVSFEGYKTRSSKLQLECRCKFDDVDMSSCNFNFHIGGLSETGDEERMIKSTHVIIGYTNWLEIKRCQEEDGKKKCVPTKASIKFKVTDGTDEVRNCEVLKCGFNLAYESGSWTECVRKGESTSVFSEESNCYLNGESTCNS